MLLAKLGGTAEAAFEIAVSAVEGAVPYVILGALIVVPAWLVLAGWRKLKGRRRSDVDARISRYRPNSDILAPMDTSYRQS